MTDSEIVKLTEKFIKQRIVLAVPNATNQIPKSFALGKVVDKSSYDSQNYRVIKFDNIRFMGDQKAKSILFSEGCIIDITHVTKQRNPN